MFPAFRPGLPVALTAVHRARGGRLLTAGALQARSWSRWAALGMLAVGGAACSDQAPQPATCGPPGPAFDVRVQVPDSHLPADLTVTALYGAGEETYRVSSSAGRSEVLFCSPQPQRPEPASDT